MVWEYAMGVEWMVREQGLDLLLGAVGCVGEHDKLLLPLHLQSAGASQRQR